MPRPGLVLRLGLLLGLSLSLAVSGAGQGSRKPIARAPHAPHEVLIKFHPQADRTARAAVQAGLHARNRRTFRSGAQHWELPDDVTAEKAIARLSRHPLVQYVEPNERLSIDAVPDDPLFAEQWALHNTGQTGGVPGADIDAERAWEITTGSRAVLVAVIDTGIDYGHPDLAANIWTNPAEIPGNGVDDDGNGFVDDVHGYDFYNDDGDPLDDNGHGTHVAGTIGAAGHNAAGVAGVSWEVSLLPLKFLGSGGFGNTADAVAAIDYAAEAHADVLNNSWGGGGFSRTMLDAIQGVREAGGLFVAAAGNNGLSTDGFPNYPANYDLPNVISVAATDAADVLAPFSNFGRVTVDLAAPGVSILSTLPGGRYIHLSGTSMAAPHVSGVAALMRAVAPHAPPDLLRLRLMETVDPVPGFGEILVSGGRLNAFAALATRDDVAPGQVGALEVVRALSNSVELRWAATGDDGPVGRAAAYEVRYATAPLDPDRLEEAALAAGAPRPSDAGEPDTMEVAGLAAGTRWHIAVRARDEWGNAGPPAFIEATTLPPPSFASAPGEFLFDLPSGGAAATVLTVRNAGDGSLDWSLLPAVSSPAGPPPAPAEAALIGKDDPDTRQGTPVLLGAGGPDRFGYRYDDSREPDGPAFEWNDLGTAAESIGSLTGDDEVAEVPIGFLFPFYGQAYGSAHISTNGWIALSAETALPVNQPLPSAAAPHLLIAPFWDDLDFGGRPRVWLARRDGVLVIEYRDVGRYRDAGRHTFQVELRATGEIRFRYLVMDGPLDSATVGVQDLAGDALQVVFNAWYLQPGLEVRIRPDVAWWTAAPRSGRLMAGEEQPVELEVSAAGLPAGTHDSALLVRTNDPARLVVSHPIVLRVAGEPGLSLDPAAVDFGDVPVGLAAEREVRLANTGSLPLDLLLQPTDPSIALVDSRRTIAPGESRLVRLSWTPAAEGTLVAALEIAGTAPGRVALHGQAVPGAGLAAAPAALHEELAGGSVTRSIRLTNTTTASLRLSIAADAGEAPLRIAAVASPVSARTGSPAVPASPWIRSAGTPASARAPYPPMMDRAPRLAGEAAPLAAAAAGAIANGGFESGGFDGWKVTHNGAAWDWSVGERGSGWFRNSDPIEGLYDAFNQFDGEAGTRYTLEQDIAVPADVARALLSYDDRIQFASYGRASTLPRVYEATLRAQDGRVLTRITRQEILLAGRSDTDLGWLRREADLAPYAGSTVRLVIEQNVPESWTGPAQIEFDDFRLDVTPMPDWIRATPTDVLIPAGGSLEILVTLDAAGAPSGLYRGALLLDTGSPAGTLRLPVSLSALPAPRLGLLGGPVHVSSTRSYASQGATTQHLLPFAVPPEGGGVVHLEVEGSYSSTQDQHAWLDMEGLVQLGVGELREDCSRGRRSVAVDAATLARIAADGTATVSVRNEKDVHAYCPINEHRVSLTYRGPTGAILYPDTFGGGTSEGSVEILNMGDSDLVVQPHTEDPLFHVLDGPIVVPPGDIAPVKVQFRPLQQGEATGTLRIRSNDPAAPETTVSLRGRCVLPPVVVIEPEALEASLISGASETRTLTLSNQGGSALKATLTVAAAGRALTTGATACRPERVLVSEFDNGTLASIDLATGAATRVASGLSGPNRGIVPMQDGAHALVVESHSGELSRIDLATGQVSAVAHGLGFPTSVVVTPDEATAYVTDAASATILRIHLDTGEVSWVPATFDLPNALALDRDGLHLFVADFMDGGIYRLDPLTGETTTVARRLALPNDLALDPEGETLYVVETIGQIAAVDLPSGTVTRLASGLVEPVGIGVDTEAVYVADYGASRALRIDRVTGAATTLAYGLIGPVGAAPEGSCARFATVTPRALALGPGESAAVQLRLDAADLPAGAHAGLLRIAGNDPVRPVLDVTLLLHVLGAPDIDLRGESVRLTSTAAYETPGAVTIHEMRPAAPLAGPGVLELAADGDFGADYEFVSVHGEGGTMLLTAGGAGVDCSTVSASYVVPEETLAGWALDGVLRFEARNTSFVGPICGANEHRLTLTYPARADALDFGTVYLGSEATRRVIVRNRGTESLEIAPRVWGPGFSVPAVSGIPSHGQVTLEVTFAPAVSGDTPGELILESNDPDEPELRVPLAARAAAAPRLEVNPATLDLSVAGDAKTAIPLTLSNTGGSDLTVSIAAVAGAGAGARRVAVVETLPDSPVPLTAVVGDPAAGAFYARESRGRRFFRYDAVSRAWVELDSAPVESGAATGAAILDGRLYSISTGEPSRIEVYDFGTGTWATRDNPLGAGTANIASDGARFLYLAWGSRFLRLDPATSETALLAPPPFPLHAAGGMRVSSGLLYAHQAEGPGGFGVYDIASGFWTLLPDLPDAAGLGAGFDLVDRAYLAPGLGTPYIFRFDPGAGKWNVHRIPGFTQSAGGLAWLPVPEPAVYAVQGWQGTGFARLVRPPSFVSLPVAAGELAAGATRTFDVAIDPGSLPAGSYEARLEITSNDPARTQVSVPLSLHVAGMPRLNVRAEPVRRMSFLSWSGPGAITRHRLELPGPPGGDGVIELYAEGDFDATTRLATLSLEGTLLGAASREGERCEAARGRFAVPRELLEQVLADGVADATVTNTGDVGEGCPVHRHTVILTYPLLPDRLEFGEVRLGMSGARAIQVLNGGTAPLDVSFSPGSSAFHVTPAVLHLPPDAAAMVALTFQPEDRGAVEALLRIESGAGSRTIALAGRGYEAPRAVAAPETMRVALPPGASTTRLLDLRNAGERPLQWQLIPRYAPVPSGGGPDAAGYAFRDSDDPAGPVFSWMDITPAGSPLPMFRDDETRGPVPLGFAFPFYGQSFSTVNVSTNGFLSFTSLMTSRFGGGTLPLPGTSTPENLIAPLWTDLDFMEDRRAWKWSDGERFIVQYNDVGLKNVPGSSLTFQVILERSGRIVFQYLTISQTPGTVTIGTQNADRTIGLLVSGTPGYLHDRLAVEIVPGGWLVPGGLAGELGGDSGVGIPILFDAVPAGVGDHAARLSFNTNDPVRPAFDVPVTLHVGEVALADLDIDPDTVNMAARGRTVRARLQLPPGYDPRAVRVPSLRLNGTLPALAGTAEFADETGDGVEEMIARFDRESFEQMLSPGENVVTLTGEVRDVTWFRGSAAVRALRPRVLQPNGGEVLVLGAPATLAWEPAPVRDPVYTLELSRDGGFTWEALTGAPVQVTSTLWVPDGPITAAARLRVTASDAHGPIGDDTSDAPFVLAAAPSSRDGTDLTLDRDAHGVVLHWRGPQGPRRIVSATAPRGPFVQAGQAEGSPWRDTLPGPEAGRIIYYVVLEAPLLSEGAPGPGESPDAPAP